jgi:hypothetical protein
MGLISKTYFLLHCDEWDRVVALPRHKFVTGATLLQLISWLPWQHIFPNKKNGFDLKNVHISQKNMLP